jgi:hypothetical protein
MDTVGRRAFLASIALVVPAFRASLDAQSFSVDDFLALSSRLTGYDNLDREVAAIFLKNLLATPGNITRLSRPDSALERDIIVAWYTGVHQVNGEAQLVTHTSALQWRALNMSAPGTCVGPFGSWSKPHRLTK